MIRFKHAWQLLNNVNYQIDKKKKNIENEILFPSIV